MFRQIQRVKPVKQSEFTPGRKSLNQQFERLIKKRSSIWNIIILTQIVKILQNVFSTMLQVSETLFPASK